MNERIVAISYSADEETEAANREVLEEHAELVFLKKLPAGERAGAIEQAEVLLSWALSREVTDEALRRAHRLSFLQLISAGVDHLNLEAIPQTTVIASNVGAYAEPMAEHVLAMALALAKRLPQRHAALAQGRWDQHLMSLTLDRAVCAILGYGGIGKATARLMRCAGARIWAVNSTGITEDDVDFIGTLSDLDHVLAVADVVVLALPLTRVTRGLIGARELALMRPEAILVNVARGGVIDQKSLYDHLLSHPGFGAGIDTWWEEPERDEAFRTDYPFFDLPNIIGSPHNSPLVPGILTVAARRAAENVLEYLNGGPPRGVVRREDYLDGA